MPKVKVLLADDHVVVARALGELLKETFDLVGVVHDGRALMELAEQTGPDVILTDITMPLLNGLDAIRQLRTRRPEIRIVVLTMHGDTQTAVEALRAGARGYVLKISPEEELITAIDQVAKGFAYVTPLVAKDVIDLLIQADQSQEGVQQLTARQREVLQLIAEGKTMKEVAGILNISPRTAESHKYEIMQALGIGTTAGLVQYAIRVKMIGA